MIKKTRVLGALQGRKRLRKAKAMLAQRKAHGLPVVMSRPMKRRGK
jgi:hypothetical protein